MKLPYVLSLAVSSVATILTSTFPAHALDFNFSFTGNDPGFSSGTVQGTIYGLIDNSTSAPTLISITQFSATLNGTTLPFVFNSIPASALFAVTNSQITGLATNIEITQVGDSFDSYLFFNHVDAGWMALFAPNYYGDDSAVIANTIFAPNLTFTPAEAQVPFDLPGGATIPALGGLLALGAIRKAKKNLVSKTRLANLTITIG